MKKLVSILLTLALAVSLTLVAVTPVAAQEGKLVGSYSYSWTTSIMNSTDFDFTVGMDPALPFPWMVPNVYYFFHSDQTPPGFPGPVGGAWLFENIDFDITAAGQTFSVTSVADDPDFEGFASLLTNGTNDMIWLGFMGDRENIASAGGQKGVQESQVFSGTDVGTDFPGWTIQRVSLTFNQIYLDPDNVDKLVLDFTVDIYASPVIEVEIDIKPGSDPNSINLKSKGVVPVAVLTTDDFDASDVDPETVGFLTTKNYSDVTLSDWGQGNFDEVWDLTQGDLTLSYTIDMSAIANAGWAVTEVGLRETGGPNIDPNLKGGWMQSNYIYADSDGNTQDNNDFHLLSKHGWSYQKYDAEDADTLITPYWSNDNYGFWFDRDGVDPWQAMMWGNIDGATYNTEGVYEMAITYHAINDNTGTMFATINGVQQGLYIGGWKDAQPEFYPAGRSFTGDMTQMQLFYGRGGGGGYVTVYDITVTGRLATGAVRWTLEDVDGDGDLDLLLHFKTQDLNLTEDSTEATLTGATYGGQPIQGTDTVNIVPKKGKK